MALPIITNNIPAPTLTIYDAFSTICYLPGATHFSCATLKSWEQPGDKAKSETNKEREDRRQAAKLLAIVCSDTWKMHFVLSLVHNPFPNAICIDVWQGHPDTFCSYNNIHCCIMCTCYGMQRVEYVLYRALRFYSFLLSVWVPWKKVNKINSTACQ